MEQPLIPRLFLTKACVVYYVVFPLLLFFPLALFLFRNLQIVSYYCCAVRNVVAVEFRREIRIRQDLKKNRTRYRYKGTDKDN